MNLANIYLLCACCFAVVAAMALTRTALNTQAKRHRRELLLRNAQSDRKEQLAARLECEGLAVSVIGYMKAQKQKRTAVNSTLFFVEGLLYQASRSYDKLSDQAGLTTLVSSYSYALVRIKLAAFFMLGGALLGSIFSTTLLFILGLVGMCLGWMSSPWAFKQEKQARKQGLEKHLSEMIEVVSLGLRSGLSFDKSLEMYHTHFATSLSAAVGFSQKQWAVGLASRESALRDLAQSYDSALFGRVAENIIRSLRFGASLAESLEASAAEARSIHKAKVEERVAKAPVKMLIPTGTLILPAMLLLVLGPVLLGLIQGF